jgi:aminoglycoside phosphotransferase family enzyme/predicted kinase
MGEQSEVVAFLSAGASYGLPGGSVTRIETHISVVFLAGQLAYKLKRAVRFSYLDYSTLELREKYCRAELTLNQRTAPELYRRVRAVTRGRDGTLAFDGAGAVLDWVLEMRRFEQSALFDQMAVAGKLTPALLRALTDEIAEFHEAAEIIPRYGGAAALEAVLAGNDANLAAAVPPLEIAAVMGLNAAARARLAAVVLLLDARRDAKKIRRCHGDLHLGNITLSENRPTLFDCIEFNEAFSCIDVLYDLAFLLMDLLHRDLRDFASLVFNRYLDLTGDHGGLPVLGLFMSVRAAIRAHVLAAQGHGEVAQSYLTLAQTLLETRRPCLVAVGGLSGSGKSTLAAALAQDFAPAPGARVVRSDVIRKALAGVAPEVRLPPVAYAAEVSAAVYAELHRQVREALDAGFSVIADATFLSAAGRAEIAALAREKGVAFFGFWLEAPEAVLQARLAARRNDASDAGAEVLRRQRLSDVGAVDWFHLDTAQGVERQRREIAALIAGQDALV